MKLKKVDRSKVEEGVVEWTDPDEKVAQLRTKNSYSVVINRYNFKQIINRNGVLLLEDVPPEEAPLPSIGAEVQFIRKKKTSGKVQWWTISEALSDLVRRNYESTLKKIGVSLRSPLPELDPEETRTILDYGISIGLSRYQAKLILRDFLQEQGDVALCSNTDS